MEHKSRVRVRVSPVLTKNAVEVELAAEEEGELVEGGGGGEERDEGAVEEREAVEI